MFLALTLTLLTKHKEEHANDMATLLENMNPGLPKRK